MDSILGSMASRWPSWATSWAASGPSWTQLGRSWRGWEAKNIVFPSGFLTYFAIPFWTDLISFWADFELELGLELDLEWILDLELDFELDLGTDLGARMGLGSLQKKFRSRTEWKKLDRVTATV